MVKKSIGKLLNDTELYIKKFPNWKMIYKMLNLVSAKKLNNLKETCEMLRIYPFEVMEIVDNLQNMGLIQSFETTNDIGETFTHFKGTKLGGMFLKYKTPVHRIPKLIRQAQKRHDRLLAKQESEVENRKQKLEQLSKKGKRTKNILD